VVLSLSPIAAVARGFHFAFQQIFDLADVVFAPVGPPTCFFHSNFSVMTDARLSPLSFPFLNKPPPPFDFALSVEGHPPHHFRSKGCLVSHPVGYATSCQACVTPPSLPKYPQSACPCSVCPSPLADVSILSSLPPPVASAPSCHQSSVWMRSQIVGPVARSTQSPLHCICPIFCPQTYLAKHGREPQDF